MRITLVLAQGLHYYVLLRSCTSQPGLSPRVHHSLNVYNDDVHGQACSDNYAFCTFAILRKMLLLVLRHPSINTCTKIFSFEAGVSGTFAEQLGLQNTFSYVSLMTYAILLK